MIAVKKKHMSRTDETIPAVVTASDWLKEIF